MIWTIVRTSWRRLKNNRSELILTFVVPIIFFSIFAVIFGSRDSSSTTPKIRVAMATHGNSQPLTATVEQIVRDIAVDLQAQPALRFSHQEAEGEMKELTALTRAEVEELVKRGMISAAIVLQVQPSGQSISEVEILSDSYDQVASQVLSSLVQRSVYKSLSPKPPAGIPSQEVNPSTQRGTNTLTESRISAPEMSPAYDNPMTATGSPQVLSVQKPTFAQSSSIDSSAIVEQSSVDAPSFGASPQRIVQTESRVPSRGALETGSVANMSLSASTGTAQLPPITTVDVLGGEKTNPTIAMYAAGIAVMFLLFSATSNSGSLLEEKENSTLDRLLCSQLNMDQLLMGKWLFLTLLGCSQLFLMFLWGSIVFHIEVLRNWQGAVAMSVVTAGAASSFALLLATLCSSRTQLSWISTIVILSMSALGGSMIPRYLMSETIQNIGLITFNAWALDGFNKVFWRELPLEQIGLELGVLASCAGLFIVLARLFAVRWERT